MIDKHASICVELTSPEILHLFSEIVNVVVEIDKGLHPHAHESLSRLGLAMGVHQGDVEDLLNRQQTIVPEILRFHEIVEAIVEIENGLHPDARECLIQRGQAMGVPTEEVIRFLNQQQPILKEGAHAIPVPNNAMLKKFLGPMELEELTHALVSGDEPTIQRLGQVAMFRIAKPHYSNEDLMNRNHAIDELEHFFNAYKSSLNSYNWPCWDYDSDYRWIEEKVRKYQKR